MTEQGNIRPDIKPAPIGEAPTPATKGTLHSLPGFTQVWERAQEAHDRGEFAPLNPSVIKLGLEQRRTELSITAAFLDETEGEVPEDLLAEIGSLNVLLNPPPIDTR